MMKQEKDCGIRASGIREVLGGKIRDDGGDHFAEAPSDPAGRIGLSVTLLLILTVKERLVRKCLSQFNIEPEIFNLDNLYKRAGIQT